MSDNRYRLTSLFVVFFAVVIFFPPVLQAAMFTSNYQVWDTGSDILSLQQFLNTHGYVVAQTGPGSPGNETTSFGPATLKTLITYQTAHGIDPTGFFGPLTRAAVNNDMSSTLSQGIATSSVATSSLHLFLHDYALGDTADDIIALQKFLNGHGFVIAQSGFGSPGSETSFFGTRTYQALVKYQAAHAIMPTGYFGPITRASINSQLTLTIGSSQYTNPTTNGGGSAPTTPTCVQVLPGLCVARSAGIGGGASGPVQDSTPTPTPDTTPPSLSGISSGTAGQTTATITWTTNETSNSKVVYGTTASYGSASTNASLVTSHSIGISSLTTSTLYHYAVVSADSQGNTATSSDQTFTTAAPSIMPLGALGIWYMDQYQSTPTPAVPNALSSVDLSQNLFRGIRRVLTVANPGFWVPQGGTFTDNAATCPDGSSEAATYNAAGDFYLTPSINLTLTAGTYTMGIWVKRNTGSDQSFAMTFLTAGATSATKTATASWQRFSFTATVSAGQQYTIPFISFNRSTGANVQICDPGLYAGAVDLGDPALSGHLYFGRSNSSSQPTYASGAVNFSSSGFGTIQFPSSISLSSTTAIAFVYKAVAGAGSGYHTFLSKVQSYTTFSAFSEHTSALDFMFSATSVAYPITNIAPVAAGWHMITGMQSSTSTQLWVDDIKLIKTVQNASSISLADLYVGNTNGLFGNYKVAAIALYPRDLTDTEVRDAYSYLSTRIAQSNNSPGRIPMTLVAEGDSITAGTGNGAYPILYGVATSSVQVVDYAVSGSTVATLVTRSAIENAIIPTSPGDRRFVLSVLIGRNDISDTNSVPGYLNSLSSYLDAERAAGFTVVVGTILPSTAVGFNAARNLANTTIRTWVGTHVDAIVDFAADATIGADSSAANSTYYVDGTHPTAAGQNALQVIYAAAINAL